MICCCHTCMAAAPTYTSEREREEYNQSRHQNEQNTASALTATFHSHSIHPVCVLLCLYFHRFVKLSIVCKDGRSFIDLRNIVLLITPTATWDHMEKTWKKETHENSQTHWTSVYVCVCVCVVISWQPPYTVMWRNHRKFTCCLCPWVINRTANWDEECVYVCWIPAHVIGHILIFTVCPCITRQIQLLWS